MIKKEHQFDVINIMRSEDLRCVKCGFNLIEYKHFEPNPNIHVQVTRCPACKNQITIPKIMVMEPSADGETAIRIDKGKTIQL